MFTPDNPPRRSDYVAAISTIREELSDREVEVLRFQFSRPGRMVTSQDIRDHFQYPNIGAANLLYGKLAKKFAQTLPMQTEPDGSERLRFWKAISTGIRASDYFQWTLRPEFGAALVDAAIVDSEEDGAVNVPDLDVHVDRFSSVEGRKKLVMHVRRERDPALVKAKKNAVSSHACEVCGFDSRSTYGVDYCEVHHLVPLANLDDECETTLEQLAILCANCHRIVHLEVPPIPLDVLKTKLNRKPSVL